jgi:hypothetical protein
MPHQPFLIAPQSTGLETDLESFLLPEDAYPQLENMYIYRGRLKRRLGYGLLGRLQLAFTSESVGNTGASPWTFNIFTASGIGGADANKTVVPGSVEITITGPIVFTDQGDGTLTSTTGGNSGTINYSTGSITLTHTAGTGVATTANFAYNPNRPVMGLWNYELSNINRERLIAFDTRYSYLYSNANSRFEVIPNSGAPITWSGSDSQFFWAVNYRLANPYDNGLWAVNYNATDGIRYYNGTTWTTFSPTISTVGPQTLQTARILIPYKGRLVALNTIENDGAADRTYVNRARFSQIGDPTNTSTSWDQDTPGRGGFVDAPTSEQILTAFFYYDTLMVGFERSLWQLRATGDFILPFVWQRVSAEFGSESTFSQVGFDQGVLMVGNRAIINATSNSATRIDQKIPDTVFNIHNEEDGYRRVHGIRDYRQELVYWTFPEARINGKFPNRILVYNYRENSWATFKDSFTCFGNYQTFDDRTWADMNMTWAQANIPWNDPSLQSAFPNVCAGNSQGFVFEIARSQIGNDDSRYISNITTADPAVVTSPNHNFEGGEWIKITNVIGMSEINTQEIFQVDPASITTNTFSLLFYNNGIVEDFETTSTYSGGGLIEELPNFEVLTKRFTPFMSQGRGVSVDHADYFLNATNSGEFSLEVIPNERNSDGRTLTVPTSLQTTANPPSTRGFQQKYWHRVYINSNAQLLQFRYFLTNAQMQNTNTVYSDVVIHALIIYARPSIRIIG